MPVCWWWKLMKKRFSFHLLGGVFLYFTLSLLWSLDATVSSQQQQMMEHKSDREYTWEADASAGRRLAGLGKWASQSEREKRHKGKLMRTKIVCVCVSSSEHIYPALWGESENMLHYIHELLTTAYTYVYHVLSPHFNYVNHRAIFFFFSFCFLTI